MKKRKIISLTLAAAIAACPVLLTGCSGDHYSQISFPAQDTSMIVTSQGGSTVAYGNYVYFINGTRGYDDTDGTANVWDEVVKGALYRAELNGTMDADKNFLPERDAEGIEFKYTDGTDYFDEPIKVVTTQKIAPKTIGTAGYKNGGLFLYDNYAFFATPNNEKNSTGTVQTTRTDYFMMPLSGGKPTKIYTSAEGVDTSSSEYAFYKHNGAVYLVTNEGGTIVSVKVDLSKAKADYPVKFEVGATSVYFPVRDTYYTGISNNTVEDFIYFVRNVKDGESQRAGTVIEAMRPDGSENFVVSMTGMTETIEGVRNGIMFYRTTNNVSETVIAYNNLHNMLMKWSPSYKAEQENATDKVTQISGIFPKSVTSTITSTYAFRADENSNTVYFVGVSGTDISLYVNNERNLVGKLCDTTGTPLFIKNDYLYFSGSNSDFYRVPLFENMDGYGEAQLLAEETASATLSCDYAMGYFTYYATVDQWADAYTYFYKVDGIEGAEPLFVGSRTGADIPTEDQIKEAKGETDSTPSDEE